MGNLSSMACGTLDEKDVSDESGSFNFCDRFMGNACHGCAAFRRRPVRSTKIKYQWRPVFAERPGRHAVLSGF
jgi:hypothetical protein